MLPLGTLFTALLVAPAVFATAALLVMQLWRLTRKPLAGIPADWEALGRDNEMALTRRRFNRENLEALEGRGGAEVIVIGGGIGGMMAAALLSRIGYRVLVLEQHDRLGGATHTFELEHAARGLPDTFYEEDPTLEAAAAQRCPDNDSEATVRCGFDSGYHYTCQAFADPLSRPGAFLRLAAGAGQQFIDLGDPYDRVMFPNGEEVRFVRGSPRQLAARLVEQLRPHAGGSDGDEDTEALLELLQQRITTFFRLARSAVSFAVRIFLVRSIGRPPKFSRWLLGGLVDRLDSWAVGGLARTGELTTAYVIKAIVGCGFSAQDVLRKRELPEGVSSRIDAAVDTLPLPQSGAAVGQMCQSPALARRWRHLLQRAMAVLIHPVGDYAAPPAESSFLAHSFVLQYYERGSSYPARSAQDISAGMARTVLRHGGDCLVGADVRHIICQGSGKATRAIGVRVCKKSAPSADPVELFASVAVVNASGIFNLYKPGGLLSSPRLTEMFQRTARFVPSTGHFYVFLCLKGSPDELQLPATNMWCLAGAGHSHTDMDGAYDAFLHQNPPSSWRTSPPKPPAVYVTFPCAKNKSAWQEEFPGVSNCIIFCDAMFDWFSDKANDDTTSATAQSTSELHHKTQEYATRKAILRDSLLEVLFEKRPDLKSCVLWVDSGSPATAEHYLGAHLGADYGTRVDTNYFSPSGLRWLMRPDTPVNGLWQAGQDAMTPSISGAMHGGVLAAFRIGGLFGAAAIVSQMLIQQYREARRLHPLENPLQLAKTVFDSWVAVQI